ncbi:hypothetical protein MAR_019844 [Mya arenaria]|uniref:Uncharacterized protein n=1 Tax=Mya arenaria TaxID=6604 RepID=A0ABY7E396_MYAAR|nr:hypothetical protein MAR_019844 [Mya arenaria]
MEHMYLAHGDEKEVAKALSTSNKEEKNVIVLKLKNKGNFKHNVSVLQNGGEHFIVCKRPSGRPIIPSDFLPCVYCYGFYQRKELWRHLKTCCLKVIHSTEQKNSLTASARVMLRAAVSTDPKGNDGAQLLEILQTRNDVIGSEIINDNLIVKFGKVLFEKLGSRRKNDVSQRMRQLVRLKTQINSNQIKKIDQLSDMFNGKNFDNVVEAVKELAGMYENQENVIQFEKPGLALRLGHNLIKAADIKFGMSMRNDDDMGANQAETFSKLYRKEWTDLISSVALASLKTNKFNKGDAMPLTDDLIKLRNHLSSKMATLTEKMNDSPTYPILDLNEGEVQWVSSHLTHTRKDLYQFVFLDLPLGESDDIPVHGESADDSIDLNLAEHLNGDDEQPAEAQSSMPVNQRQKRPRLTKKRHIQESDSEDEQPAEAQSSMPVNQRPKRPRLSKKRHIQESDSEDVADDDSLIDPSLIDSGREESSTDDEQTSKNFIQQQIFYKQRWSETENKIFIQIFSACLTDKHMPTLTAIKLAASKMPQRTKHEEMFGNYTCLTGFDTFCVPHSIPLGLKLKYFIPPPFIFLEWKKGLSCGYVEHALVLYIVPVLSETQ